jgi:hypothetical protein
VGGERIRVTEEHPFWEAEQRAWVRAGDLRAGSPVAMLRGSEIVPSTVGSVRAEELAEPVAVYNLTVDGEENYFAAGVLVHNKSSSSGFLPSSSGSSGSSAGSGSYGSGATGDTAGSSAGSGSFGPGSTADTAGSSSAGSTSSTGDTGPGDTAP